MLKCTFFLHVVLYFFIMGCRKPAPGPELSIAHPQLLPALPLILASRENPNAIQIRLQPFQDHALSLAAFLRGESDLLFTGTTLGAMQATKGIQLWRTPVWGTASVIVTEAFQPDALLAEGANPNLRILKSLEAKQIALPFQGSPNDIQLRRLLTHSNTRARLLYQPHLQAVAALMAGQIDAVVVPEPIAAELIAKHGARRLLVLSDAEIEALGEIAPAPMVSFFIRKDLGEGKKKLLPQLEQALQASLRKLQQPTEALLVRESATFKISPDILRVGLEHTRFEWPTPERARDRTLSFLAAAGIERPPADFFLD